MNYDQKDLAETLDQSDRRKVLLFTGIPYYAQGVLALVMGVICFLNNNVYFGLLFIAFVFIFAVLGSEGFFVSEKRQTELVTSGLVSMKLLDLRKTGTKVSREDADSIRFRYDPIFREKIIDKVHEAQDKDYENRVHTAEAELKRLKKARVDKLNEIMLKRWIKVDEYLSYSPEEGRFHLQGQTYPFNAVRSAEINERTKRHFLTVYCTHLGVIVNISGFSREVVILDSEIEKSDEEYSEAFTKAARMTEAFQTISTMPVPSYVIPPDENPEVLALDEKIDEAEIRLNEEISHVPDYAVPARYLKEVD